MSAIKHTLVLGNLLSNDLINVVSGCEQWV